MSQVTESSPSASGVTSVSLVYSGNFTVQFLCITELLLNLKWFCKSQ